MGSPRKPSRRLIGGLTALVLLAAGGTVAASAPLPHSAPIAAAPAYGGHLTVAGEAEVANPWTPATMLCDSYCYVRARTFFDQVAVLGEDRQVYGWLAESIEPNDDFTEWTVTIRPGITFTDGTPLDAAAVIYNLQETGTGLLVSQYVSDVARVPDPDNPERQILKIEQLDDLSFVIYTGKGGDPEQPLPWPNFPITLTSQFGLIASPTWLQAVKDDPELASRPIGSGPFVVDSYSPRESLELSRNPDSWATDADGNQLPYLDSMTFRVVEDPEVSYEALQSGDVDIVTTFNGAVVGDALAAGDDVTLDLQEQYTETSYLMIDLTKPPLDDERVRCALSIAINRQEIIDSVGATDVATPANGVFSPGQQGYLDDNGFSVEPDLDAAGALIEEYEAETGEDVTFTLGHTPPNYVSTAAELLQGYWSEIGVDVELQTIPQGDLINLALFGAPEFQIFIWRNHAGVLIDQQYLWWHSDNAAPDGELALNMARVDDPDIDAGLEAARTAPIPEQGQAAAEQVNRSFADHCYNIPLSWGAWGIIAQPAVVGGGTATTPEGAVMLQSAGMFWAHVLSLAES